MRKICWCSQTIPHWCCHYITRTIKPLNFLWHWILWHTFINAKYFSYFFKKNLFPTYVCINLCVYRHISARHVYGKEDNCGSWISYHVGLGDRNQIIRISGIHCYLLSHLASLPVFCFWNHHLSWLTLFLISCSFALIVCLLQILFRDCSLSAPKSKS